MPTGFLAKQTQDIEDIGQPVTACFMTTTNVDPTNWCVAFVWIPIDFKHSPHTPLTSHQKGGCSRNMMACEDSGTQWRRRSFRGEGIDSSSLKRLSMPCLRISFSMASSGKTCLSLYLHTPVTHTHLLFVSIIRYGRENFQEAMKISNRVDTELIDWSKFKFMVFDIPNHSGTYQDRYLKLGKFRSSHITQFTLFLILPTSGLCT